MAAVEQAETEAIRKGFAQILSGNGSDGVLGQTVVETEAGAVVKVAALSVEALTESGDPVNISAGANSSAGVEIDEGP